MNELTQEENQERIRALLSIAHSSNGSAWIDQGMRYALMHVGASRGRSQVFASDGVRWWRSLHLVLTIDIYNDTLVTAHYSLRHIPMLPKVDIERAGMVAVAPHELPSAIEVGETIIYDHTQRGAHDGRHRKEVYKYGPTG